MKHRLTLLVMLLVFPLAALAATVTVSPFDNLKTKVEGATSGDMVELLKGTHVVIAEINIPTGVSIMADPAAPHGTVVVQGGNNSTRLTIFRSTGSGITISGIKFVPDPAATLGGRAVWVPVGGENLTFNDNIVDRFTDAVFALLQTGGTLEFRNNRVTIVDRDPAANNNFLGGNAALTVLFADLDALDASGNTVHGPGRNVSRFIAVVGIIVFNTTQTIGRVDIWNNAISNFDLGIFSSGQVGLDGATIAENRLHSNGAGIEVGQVPDPDITIPTPAESTTLFKNRITGNDFGVIIAANAMGTTLTRNQIAGNSEAAIIDDAATGETTIGDNLIRGKDTGNRPNLPPGKAFDPVIGPPAS